MRTWLLLAYKVPRDPTSSRVYVWRKLKRLGAIAIQDAVWVLPSTPQTREQFRWLAAEIDELAGEATLWESSLVLPGKGDALVGQFESQVERGYREILAKLNGRNPDLAALSRRYQQVKCQDFFRSEIGRQVREALIAAGGEAKQ